MYQGYNKPNTYIAAQGKQYKNLTVYIDKARNYGNRSFAKYCWWFLEDDLGKQTFDHCYADKMFWRKSKHIITLRIMLLALIFASSLLAQVWGVLASECWWERPTWAQPHYHTNSCAAFCWILCQKNDSNMCKLIIKHYSPSYLHQYWTACLACIL